MPNDYQMVREARKKAAQQDMTGVTDPKKLLKSNTQRIDKNVYTPEQMIQGGVLKGPIDPVRGA